MTEYLKQSMDGLSPALTPEPFQFKRETVYMEDKKLSNPTNNQTLDNRRSDFIKSNRKRNITQVLQSHNSVQNEVVEEEEEKNVDNDKD